MVPVGVRIVSVGAREGARWCRTWVFLGWAWRPTPPGAALASCDDGDMTIAVHASPVPARACVNGKYRTLLRTIEVPQDRAGYTDFRDWGYWTGTAYAGYTDLPPGYWVYCY